MAVSSAKKPARKPRFVEKKVGGSKNGGTRLVRVKKLTNNVPTLDEPKKALKSKKTRQTSGGVRRIRPSIKPGVVAIILAGVHKGKRVVILKQLTTGLLLITGPFKVNGCPLRRIDPRYLIATSTFIDVSSVKVPEKINDNYFRRARTTKKPVKKDGDIFEAKKVEYKASEERKKDQKEVDKQLLDAIKKHPEGAMLKSYLRHNFAFSKGQYPHKMVF